MNYFIIVGIALIAFIASMIWYMLFGKVLAKLKPEAYGKMNPNPIKMLVEVVRNIILVLILSFLLKAFGYSLMQEIILSLVLWVGFPVLLFIGSVSYEKVPVKLAAIHAGDWLIKIILMLILLGLWR